MPLDYFSYNDLIFDHFFNPQRSGQATLLAFDEDEARSLAVSIGEPSEAFAQQVLTAVRDTYRTQGGFNWWRRRRARERVALLACSVFTMASLSIDDEAGFYTKFYRDVLGSESASKYAECAILSEWWEDLRIYLNDDRAGQLGRLLFLHVVKYKNLNYPASQSVLRGVDRRWLWEFFSRSIADPAINLSRERFLTIWRPGAQGETVGINRMGSKLLDHDNSAVLVWEIFAGEFEAWRNDPVQQEKIARRRIRRDSRPGNRHGRVSVSEHSLAQDDGGAISRVRTRYSLFRPMFPANEPFVLRLEVLPPPDVCLALPELDDGWVSVPEYAVTASQFCSGFTLSVESFPVLVPSNHILCFRDDSTGIRSIDKLPAGSCISLLYEEDMASDIDDFLRVHLSNRVDLRLEPALAGLQGVSGTLDPALTEADLPPALQALFTRSSVELSFRLGLRLRDGKYIFGGPPMLRFMHATKTEAVLTIDGIETGSVRRGLNSLPAGLASGIHRVTVLERTATVGIAYPEDVEAQTYDLRDNDFGFIARLRPPLIQPSASAFATPRAELENMNAVVIQGADLMLPYDRSA